MSVRNPAPTTLGRSRVLDFLLGVMCIVIIGAGIVVLIAGFSAMVSTNARVEQLLASATTSGIAVDAISRLRDIGQGVLQANTIAFLFQVFSVGLIGACAYLVRRFWRTADKTDEKLREYARRFAVLAPFLRGRVDALNILNRITNAHLLIEVIGVTQDQGVIASVTAIARESVVEATGLVNRAITTHCGMVSAERAAIQDSAENAGRRLKSLATTPGVNQGSQAGLDDLVKRLEAFTALLKSKPFEEWYDQDFESLL
jgi:hypothetical protein